MLPCCEVDRLRFMSMIGMLPLMPPPIEVRLPPKTA